MNEVGRKVRQTIVAAFGEAIFDRDIAPHARGVCAALLHCNKKLRAQYQYNVSDPIGSGFIASRRDAEQFSLRFCFPVVH